MDHHGISAGVCYYTAAAWLEQEKNIMNKICCVNKFSKINFCNFFFYLKLWSLENNPSSFQFTGSKFLSVARQKYGHFIEIPVLTFVSLNSISIRGVCNFFPFQSMTCKWGHKRSEDRGKKVVI